MLPVRQLPSAARRLAQAILPLPRLLRQTASEFSASSSKLCWLKATLPVFHRQPVLWLFPEIYCRVSYDNDSNGSANGNYGQGVSSGIPTPNNARAAGDIIPTGVRVMKAYPSFVKLILTSTENLLQTLTAAPLYKFSVTANAGDVYLFKFHFTVGSSTVSATTSHFGLYAYTDSGFSQADTTFTTDGLINGLIITMVWMPFKASQARLILFIRIRPVFAATTTYKIPSGSTRWFFLKGDINGVATGNISENITVRLDGDRGFAPMAIAATVAGASNFVWSPNSTTSVNARY